MDLEALREKINGHWEFPVPQRNIEDSKYGIDPAAQNDKAIRSAAVEGGEYWQICGRAEVVEYLMVFDSKYGIDQSIGQ